MDNNELDKILKEKLKNKIVPSYEFEKRINSFIEEEKNKRKEINKTIEFNEKKSNHNKSKKIRYKKLIQYLSIAAVFLVIVSAGINYNNLPINVNNKESNIICIKTIEPTKMNSGILENNSEFLIKVEGENVTAEDVQKSLYIEPALDYTIEKTSNKNEYKLKFKQNIPDNTILKLQYVKNQITENSWAYETQNKLSVTKTYPTNNSNPVSENTIIDIEFSYANINNFEQNVNIMPKVEGNWTHLGKVWRFTPTSKLIDGEKYVVTINKGISSGNDVLENDYVFNFTVGETYNNNKIEISSVSADGIKTVKPDEKITFNYVFNNIEFGKAEIDRFDSIDDFIKFLQNGRIENIEKLGDYEVESYKANENEGIIELEQKISKGYYLAILKDLNGKILSKEPIQVSEISSYAMETERDLIVWVANGENLVSNIEVEYLGKKVTTDVNGIAKFDKIIDDSKTIKYAKVGNELVIGIYNYSSEIYPNCYIYTDRPLYKNTDTINIWGFVPRNLFYDKIDEEFYIQLADAEKQKVNVDENGNFKYQIKLENNLSEDTNISLWYKDTQIAFRDITIKNYELQNYIYEVVNAKKVVSEGETVNLDIKVTHITGLTVPNKKVTIKHGEKLDTKITGEDGIAHFNIKIDSAKQKDDTSPTYKTVEIFNGDENEYTSSETEYNMIALKRNTYTKISEPKSGKYQAIIYKLNKDENKDVSYDLHELYDGTYETEVNVNLVEEVRNKYISEYNYNEYTKENEPMYAYTEPISNRKKIKTITSNNGAVEVLENELQTKEDTKDSIYSYYIEFEYKDPNGKDVVDSTYIDNNRNNTEIGYVKGIIEDESYSRINEIYELKNTSFNYYNYFVYRYLLKSDNQKYGIGDKIKLTLAESTKKGIEEIENKGKILTIAFKEDIIDTKIITDSSFEYEFKEKDFPGVKITSCYFINGKFYRMPDNYFDFDEENRNINIEIKENKEEYKPGDEVTLNIKTTNNGKPIKANLNLSVVNEAVFEIKGDETDLIQNIYRTKDYASYTYSSLGEMLYCTIGGAGDGKGPIRANFADTAYFDIISTDANGKAEVKFKLPDNVTTYRVTVHGTNKDLYLGVNTKTIKSKLNFFVQSTKPRGLKKADDVVLNAIAISDSKIDTKYSFTIKEIEKTLTIDGKTNSTSSVNFGKLPVGIYHVQVRSVIGIGEDTIEYEFNVDETTLSVKNKTTIGINENTNIKVSKNPIVLEIYNKNASKNVKYLDFLESTISSRLDTQLAYNIAQGLKEKYYGTTQNINEITLYNYKGENGYLKKLQNGEEDLVLTALATYYANYNDTRDTYLNNNNVFEYYLIKAAEGKPVLNDLLYLKEEKDISNYDKLLITLALNFAGDYKNASNLYEDISLTTEESREYNSIVALIDTFIRKEKAETEIDELIQNSPSDEYLRFACISYLQNKSVDIEKTENVRITTKNTTKEMSINGMQIKTYTIYDTDIDNIKFETESQDLMVSYYYQTLLENIDKDKISKDIKIKTQGDLKKGNTINLVIEFDKSYEGEVKIALPNSLRLAKNYNYNNRDNDYYLQSNNIENISIYKAKKCSKIELPLLVINKGNYKFESIVCKVDDIYHISPEFEIDI